MKIWNFLRICLKSYLILTVFYNKGIIVQANSSNHGHQDDHESLLNSNETHDHLERDHIHIGSDERFSDWGRETDCDFACNDKKCIATSKVCDNIVDCPNVKDEMDCDCHKRIGEKKLCDGFKDCPNGEDERGCSGCSDAEFSCNSAVNRDGSIKCIPMRKRCDGHSDCSLSEDEEDCFRLTTLRNDERGLSSKGFLQKRIGNAWYFICPGTKPEHLLTRYADKVCLSIVGETAEKAKFIRKTITSKMKKLISEDVKFAIVGDSDSKFTIINGECPSKTMLALDCPSPVCGWSAKDTKSRVKRHGNIIEDLDQLSELTAKIVGGKNSLEGDWPSLIAIYRNGTFHCGGSILDASWIMTAGHCFAKKEKYVFEVQAGMLRRFSWSPTEQTRQVTNIYVHERYDSKIFSNDIALMKLDKPLKFSKWVAPACIVRSDQKELDPHVGQSCTVAGWGDIAESVRGPDQLQQVALPVIAKCLESFTKDTMQICAGVKEGGLDACQGDSGGPFACKDDKGQSMLAGIVSFGRGCARPNQPGVYTRVSYFTPWIDSVVSEQNKQVKSQVQPLQCPGEKCIRSAGECVFEKMICDRKIDCLDASDEIDCEYPEGDFSNDFQIDERAYSDVVVASHEDEEHVHNYGAAKLCGPNEFQCVKTKSCVPDNERCDGTFGCSDGTDEMHCTCGTVIANRFPHLKCDGFKNCHDGSDESITECDFCNGKLNHVKCPFSNECIQERNWCDGNKDCAGGEDEIDCFRLIRSSKSLHLVSEDFLGDKHSRAQNSGYLVKRQKSMKWSSICEAEEEEEDSSSSEDFSHAFICALLGFNSHEPSVLTRIPRETGNVNSSRLYVARPLPTPPLAAPISRSFIEEQEGEEEFVMERASKNCTTFKRIICGELKCGIEKLSTTTELFGTQPWFIIITIDGIPKCSGTLIHKQWLLASTKCIMENINSLTDEYVAAIASYSNQTIVVSSPIEQIKRINSIDTIPGYEENDTSGLLYLHLESSIKPDHFANPICTKLSDDNIDSDLFKSESAQSAADCKKVSFINEEIRKEKVELDILHSKQGESFALKMNKKLCQESNQSFIYCTNDKKIWYFIGFIDNINQTECEKNKFIQLFNPIYGKIASKTIEKLNSPPNQNVHPPNCKGVRCPLGNCIDKSNICDNIAQCSDNEDEKKCTRNFLRATFGDDDEDEVNDEEFDDELQLGNNEINANFTTKICPEGHFKCQSTGNCVPLSGWCDLVYDCGPDDLTDEPEDDEECSCRHYLALVAPESVCDSIPDCGNREDEIGQHCKCNDQAFHCANSINDDDDVEGEDDDNDQKNAIKCINSIFVCDGVKDCLNGEDEAAEQCIGVSASLIEMQNTTTNTEAGVSPSLTKGYVMVKHQGNWHPYCINDWSLEFGNTICSIVNSDLILDKLEIFEPETLGFEQFLFLEDFNGEKNLRQIAKVNSEEEIDIFVSDEEEYSVETLESCEIAFIKCKEG